MEFPVYINSNVFNTIEYVVFDLLLAIGVYIFTSKLVGLYNCYDALKNSNKSHLREDVRVPPLFETGIKCTKKRLFYAVVALRIFSWILILATNLLIRGGSIPVVTQSKMTVITRGSFSIFDPQSLLIRYRIRRLSCVQRTHNSTYYGEIRNGTCETNRELFAGQPIQFGLSFESTQVTTKGCTPRNETDFVYQFFDCTSNSSKNGTLSREDIELKIDCLFNRTGGQSSEKSCIVVNERGPPYTSCSRRKSISQEKDIFECGTGPLQKTIYCDWITEYLTPFSLCDNAVIGCTTNKAFCAGLVHHEGETLMCEQLELGNQDNHTAVCMKAIGADWNITEWIPLFESPVVPSIRDAIAVTYGAGSEERMLKTLVPDERQPVTEVHFLWVAALSIKIVMVAALFVACEVVRRYYGVFAVANDEFKILSLLTTTSNRIRRGRRANGNQGTQLFVTLDNGVARLHDNEEE